MKTIPTLLRYALCLASFAFVWSCTNGNGTDNPVDSTDRNRDTGKGKPLMMYRLRLTTDQFDSLDSYQGNQLVFQFFYPGSANCQSPTLYAYAMKTGNKSTGKPPVQLAYDSVGTEPFTGRAQVLGDQQILVTSMKELLKQSSGGYQGKKLYFLFTPKFQASNPHIYYDVSLAGGDKFMDAVSRTNPSPPSSAF